MDLVEARIPLLVSRLSLKKMEASLNFKENVMHMPGGRRVRLIELRSGHLSFNFTPSTGKNVGRKASKIPTYHSDKPKNDSSGEEEVKIIDEPMFWKIHRHLAHCSVQTIQRLGKTAGYRFDIEKGKEWLEKCSCHRDDRTPQMPVVSKHVEETPGVTIFMDLYYPCTQDTQAHPALIVVCPMTRYTASKFARNLTPGCIIGLLLIIWIGVMGSPKLIVVDQGRPFQGHLWNQSMETYSVKMTAIPAESPNQLG